MEQISQAIKPAIVYLGAGATIFIEVVTKVQSVMSLLVVIATFIYIVYQIMEKERARRKDRRSRP